MSNNKNEETCQINPGVWTRWIKPYLYSIIWLLFVMLFAYLAIIVEYFLATEPIPFFEAYSKTQSSYIACFANGGFLFFAAVDYWQTHHDYKKNKLQSFVIVVFILSIIFTIALPPLTNYICEQNGILNSRGNNYSITWTCYTMHMFYLFSLLVLRGETRRVRIVEDYINTYKQNKY